MSAVIYMDYIFRLVGGAWLERLSQPQVLPQILRFPSLCVSVCVRVCPCARVCIYSKLGACLVQREDYKGAASLG